MVPGGAFSMGDLSGEGWETEIPVHEVAVPAFMLGKYEVTFAQWDACVADGGCEDYEPSDVDWHGFDRRDKEHWQGNSRRRWYGHSRPVANISWDDVQLFIDWLNHKTGGGYRLPTEAEWEYAARAGSVTEYGWGDDIGHNQANCRGCGSRWDNNQTAPVGSFAANAWGLHDMHGNVWEWVQDCWNKNYVGAPGDGSAWRTGECKGRVIRGGSLVNIPEALRSAYRYARPGSERTIHTGFRLARDYQVKK